MAKTPHIGSRIQTQELDALLGPNRRWPKRLRLACGIAAFVGLSGGSFVASSQEDTTTSTTQEPAESETTSATLSEEQKRERDRAVANLNVATAEDKKLAEALNDTTAKANATIERLEAASQRIEEADKVAQTTAEELAKSDAKQALVEEQLKLQAVENFKNSSSSAEFGLLDNADSAQERLRKSELLNKANASTGELLTELQAILEDREIANSVALRAKAVSEKAAGEYEVELELLKGQQKEQLVLKNEAERRVARSSAHLATFAAENEAIQQVIAESGSVAPITGGISNPTDASLQGFQWPIDLTVEGVRVGRGFGTRTDPFTGKPRNHNGVDVPAPEGTPILAAKEGVIIYADWRGGYGKTTIVDHGDGTTTLYAHQVDYALGEGDSVKRGDVLGYVGTTGRSTGNHLHFEVRVNGSATNPQPYLPE